MIRNRGQIGICSAALFILLACGIVSTARAGPSFALMNDPEAAGGQTSSGTLDSEFDEFEGFDEFESEPAPPVFDPLVGYNRTMTRVNDRLYFWVLKPAAQAYGAVLPEFARQCFSRFFKNLGFPVRLVNTLFQVKLKGAGVETLRFGVNSTVGIIGFFDPAKKWMHLSPYEEDCGQTLGYYGLNGGFHLVLPFFGPSNLRDALGRVPEFFLDPVSYYIPGAFAVRVVNRTSLHIGEYESFRKDAMDMYILFRNAYKQNRKKKIEE